MSERQTVLIKVPAPGGFQECRLHIRPIPALVALAAHEALDTLSDAPLAEMLWDRARQSGGAR